MSTATAHAGALGKLKPTSVVGYGLGDFGCNLSFSLATSWLLFYYTDVAGFSAAAMGTMFFVVRLWDAVADVLAGRAVDSVMTRWGKFRPFIMFGAVPLLLINVLTFYVPASFQRQNPADAPLTWGPGVMWAYATYAVLGLAYSMVNIPYGSMASAMTQSVTERAKLVAARAFGSAVGGVFLTFVIAPPISALQKKSQGAYKAFTDAKKANDTAKMAELQGQIQDIQHQLQNIFTQTTLLFVVLGTIAFMLVAYWCREAVVRTSPKTSIKETLDTLKANGPLGILCASSFFYLIGLFAVGPISSYYARYILGDMNWTLPMALVNVGISLAITPIIPAMITKLGKKNIYQYCGLLTMVGGLGLFFLPSNNAAGGAISTIAIAALVLLAIKGVGGSLINTVMFGLEADTVEYGEWKTGRRSEGATYSIFSFTRKITQSIAGFISGWLLTAGAYVANAPQQSESAITAMKAGIGLIPAIAAALAMLVFTVYPLNDAKFRQVRDETEARKAAALAAGKPVD